MHKLLKSSVMAVALVAVALAAAPDAEARFKTRSFGGGSSWSRSSTPSKPAVSASRFGGGNSMGMSRPDVVQKAAPKPAPQPAPQTFTPRSAPAPHTGTFSYPNRPSAPQPSRSGSWVAPAIAGAAIGAAAGYALADDNTAAAQPETQRAPTASASAEVTERLAEESARAPVPPVQGPIAGAPVTMSPAVAPATESIWPMLLLLAGVVGVGALGYRLLKRPAATQPLASRASSGLGPVAQPYSAQSKLPAPDTIFACNFFRNVQELNNAGDLEQLKRLLTPEVFEDITVDIRSRATPTATQVHQVDAELLDFTEFGERQVASFKMVAVLSEYPSAERSTVVEVWHFVRSNDFGAPWCLAGIELVSD